MPEADMGEHVGEELPVPVPEMDIDRNHGKVIWKSLEDILQDEAGYVDYYQNRRDITKLYLKRLLIIVFLTFQTLADFPKCLKNRRFSI